MKIEEMFPKLINQVVLEFEENKSIRFSVSDKVMEEVLSILEFRPREALQIK